jgi:hypothetical protein
MPWHGNSEFAHATHFRPVTVGEQAVLLANIKRLFREGVISRTTRDVGCVLLKHVNNETGRCDPGKARLAKEAACSLRTVGTALQALKQTKILEWTRRLMRTARGARQTSSAYRFAVSAFDALAKAVKPTKAKKETITTTVAAATTQQSNIEAAKEMAREATISLQERANQMQMRLAANYMNRGTYRG